MQIPIKVISFPSPSDADYDRAEDAANRRKERDIDCRLGERFNEIQRDKEIINKIAQMKDISDEQFGIIFNSMYVKYESRQRYVYGVENVFKVEDFAVIVRRLITRTEK